MSKTIEPAVSSANPENRVHTIPKKPPTPSLMAVNLNEKARQKTGEERAKHRNGARGSASNKNRPTNKTTLRIDIQPDSRDWVLPHGPWDIGIFSDYKAAIAEGIRIGQRQVAEASVFIHNQGGQSFLIWQSRMG